MEPVDEPSRGRINDAPIDTKVEHASSRSINEHPNQNSKPPSNDDDGGVNDSINPTKDERPKSDVYDDTDDVMIVDSAIQEEPVEQQEPNDQEAVKEETVPPEPSEDNDDCPFTTSNHNHNKRNKSKMKKQKSTKIEIKLSKESQERAESSSLKFVPLEHKGFIIDTHDTLDMPDLEDEIEDSLAFFDRPHEDQDPIYQELCKEKEKQKFKEQLAVIQQEDMTGRQQLETLISEQQRERQASTFARYKARSIADQKKDSATLIQLYNERMASNQTKINASIQMLRKRHNLESQKMMQQHREQARKRRLTEQMVTAEWEQHLRRLRIKLQRQLQEFASKSQEVKKRCENDFKAKQENLRKQYEKQLRDLEANRPLINGRIAESFNQLSQRYMKRHILKMDRKRQALLEAFKGPDKDTTEKKTKPDTSSSIEQPKSKKNDKIELQPPSPFESYHPWTADSPHPKAGSAARHKHRKNVLSQINKQLSVEIHNEGIWMSIIPNKPSENDNTNKSKSAGTEEEKEGNTSGTTNKETFIPWSIKARMVLEAIICGEVHDEINRRFDFGDLATSYGGHLRCVMTDLRTSDVTASTQRAEAVTEHEEAYFADLEKKSVESAILAATAEKNLATAEQSYSDLVLKGEEAAKMVEKTNADLQQFRKKCAGYLDSDGKPLSTNRPSDTQSLLKATTGYKGNVEKAEKRVKDTQSATVEAKEQVTKGEAAVKQAQKAASTAASILKRKKTIALQKSSQNSRVRMSEAAEAERASVRVSDFISSLEITASKRRKQCDHMRNNNAASAWVQALPGIPGSLRKSLWHKIHRHRQQIVLRPTQETLVSELNTNVADNVNPPHYMKRSQKVEWTNAEVQKAEQNFLLAMHPVSGDKPLSCIPAPGISPADKWGEPGWHVELGVPAKGRSDSILPCAPSFPIFEKNLSEICSAPGRQAASMTRTSHLRSLSLGLSTLATATSLAESNPAIAVVPSNHTVDAQDPLKADEEVLSVGYSFSIRPTKPKTSSSSRSRPTPSKDNANSPATTSKVSTTSSAQPQTGEAGKSAPATTKKPSTVTKNDRKRSAASRQDSSSSRPAQRKRSKTEPKPKPKSKIPIASTPVPAAASVTAPTPAPAPLPVPVPVPTPVQAPAAQPPKLIQKQRPAQNTSASPVAGYGSQQVPSDIEPNSRSQYTQFMKSTMPPKVPVGQNNPSIQQQRAKLQQRLLQQQRHQQQQQLHHQQQQQQHQHQQQQQHPFQNSQQHQQQMAQIRMMQQASPPGGQVPFNQSPQTMQQMQQFFAPLPQQGFQQQPLGMPTRMMGQPNTMGRNLQGNPGIRRDAQPQTEDQSDPLFMLKDM